VKWIAVEQPPLGIQAIGEVVRLLHRAHEHFRVLGQIPVERGGPSFGSADNDEIGKH